MYAFIEGFILAQWIKGLAQKFVVIASEITVENG